MTPPRTSRPAERAVSCADLPEYCARSGVEDRPVALFVLGMHPFVRRKPNIKHMKQIARASSFAKALEKGRI